MQYNALKPNLNGVFLWQRVPVTEKSGRIHTSAVSVAVLPQADEVLKDMFCVSFVFLSVWKIVRLFCWEFC